VQTEAYEKKGGVSPRKRSLHEVYYDFFRKGMRKKGRAVLPAGLEEKRRPFGKGNIVWGFVGCGYREGGKN